MPSPRKNRETHPSRHHGERGVDSVSAPRMVRHSGELRGAALVIVLSFLIIITGLVVAFLSSVTNDATATTAAAAGVTTRGLADSAIQLTIAQIRDATAGFARNANGSLNMDSPVCWASQPGAIRTYDTNGSSGGGNASGGGGAVYKLYSSTKMVDTAGNNPTNDLPSSSSWVSRSALYTDLNAPVITTRSGVSLTHYPIMDPAMTNTVNGSPVIDGFSISNVPAMTGVSNPAAMPVTWLYMLKDGTIIAPDTSSTTTATFNSAPVQPSSNNPIVGRIAFWTDDETCKLNINTASEGSFWAVPSFSTSADQAFAQYPPGAGEFNRYPGHPASTCLSPVLWSVMGLDNPAQLVIPNPAQNNTGALSVNDRHITGVMSYGTVLYFNKPRYLASSLTNYLSNLFSNVTPRYAWGGSFGGTNCLITNASSNSAIRLPTNRLYASVDEFFFAPSNSVGASLGRTTNTVFLSGSGITNSAQFVAGLRFFLTAQSRAPEVNPLNLPKISLWPVPDNNRATVNPNSTANRTRTFYDQVIAFCSSLGTNGTNAYYFTRYDASSSANDLTAGAVAGRNQQLYDYFRRQLNRPVPGFKGAFKSSNKWTSGQTDQIATEIYDYIRSCINLCDASMATNAAAFTSYNFSNSYTVPPVSGGLVSNVISGSGGGQVVPIRIQNPDGGTLTQGMGRFPTLRGGALWFTAAAANQPPLICYPDGKPKVWFRGASWIEISTNISGVSSIQASYITNVLAGQAWAQINPLHPWTTPFTNSTNINGIACVPQYNVGGRAVLADSTPNAYKPVGAGYTLAPPISRGIFDANSVNKVYPIFALSTNNGFVSMSNSAGVPTRTFPSYASSNNGTGMLHYGTNLSAGPVGSNGVIGWYSNNTPATKMYDVLVVSLAANGVSIATPSTPVTHLGLPFLTVQNTTNGAFDIPNANYYYGPNLTNTMAAFPPHVTVVQCAFLPNFGTVTPGASGLNPKLSLSVSGLNTLRINGNTLTFAGSAASSILSVTNTENEPARYLHDQGLMSLMATATNGTNQLYSTNDVLVTNVASTTSFANYSFPFTGGTLTCTLSSSLGSASAVQTLAMNFPSPSAGFATPKLPLYIPAGNGVPSGHMQFPWPSTLANNYFTTNTDILSGVATTITNYVSWFYQRPGLTNNGLSFRPVGTSSANTKLKSAASTGNEFFLFPSVMICSLTGDLSTNWNALNAITADTIQSVDLLTGDPRMIACLTNVSADFFTNNPLYGYAGMVTVNGWSEPLRNAHSITAGSVQLNGGNFGTLLFTNGADSHWLPPLVSRGVSLLTNLPGVTAATNLMAYPIFETRSTSTYYLSGAAGYGNRPLSGPFARSTNSLFWSSFTNGGDFDTGMGFFSDGPYMGKVDEGFAATNNVLNIGITPYYALKGTIPGGALFSPNRMVPSPVIFGSLPVGISGSGTNILTNAWKTLQFSPNPNSPNATNPVRSAAAGFNAAGKTITNPVLPDHLLLDFFQMPVVQPYPISDPFSMAGKVNMNYQIVPFAHINRDAAIRGVLKPVMITAVDARWGYDYKLRSTNNYSDNSSQMYSDSAVRSPINSIAYNGTPSGFESTTGEWYFHYPIHLSNTLAQFNARFSSTPGGDLFRSPSEICALWLYPAQQPTTANPLANTNALTNWDANNANITAWWYGTSLSDMSAKSLTGDNIRERPYNYLYPRLTTKSNTYQIHYRVQSLKQTPAAHPSSWATWIDPSAGGITDKILGEQRGSAMIERFIDPGDPTLPDFTTSVTSGGGRSSSVAPMDTYYRFRVFNAKEFTP